MVIHTNLVIEVSRVREVTVVSLEGELDAYTSPDLRETVVRLIEEGARKFTLNLLKVDYIDSVGLGALVGCLKRTAEHRGNINLVCTNLQIKKVFDITGLSKFFHICDTEKQALKLYGVTPAPATPRTE